MNDSTNNAKDIDVAPTQQIQLQTIYNLFIKLIVFVNHSIRATIVNYLYCVCV